MADFPQLTAEGIGIMLVSASSVISSIIIWRRTSSITSYSNLDSFYKGILDVGIQYPELRNWSVTEDYEKSFAGPSDFFRYHTYAAMTWNFCETAYDYSKSKYHKKTWYPAIKTEAHLHWKWFFTRKWNITFKKEFVNGVITILQNDEEGRFDSNFHEKLKKYIENQNGKITSVNKSKYEIKWY